MPTDNQQNQSDNTTKNPIPSSSDNISSSEANITDTAHNKVSRPRTTRANTHEKKSTIVEIVSIPKIDETEAVEANRIARESNKIAKFSTRVNFFLLLVTIILAGAAIYQYKTSQSAAQIAQKTLDSANAFNQRMFKLQQEAYKESREDAIENNKREISRDKRAEKSLKIQNQALDVTRDEFIKINEPILTIDKIENLNIEAGKDITFTYIITSLGNNPVHIYRSGEAITAFKVADSAEYYNNPFRGQYEITKGSLFLTKEHPVTSAFDGRGYNEYMVKLFNSGGCRLDFFGSIYYTSNISKTKRRFDFAVIISKKPLGIIFESPYSKNYDIK